MAGNAKSGALSPSGSERLEKALQVQKIEVLSALLDGRLLIRLDHTAVIADKVVQNKIRKVSFQTEQKERYNAFTQDVGKFGVIEPLQAFPAWQGDTVLIKLFSGFNRYAATKANQLDVILHPNLDETSAVELGMKLNHLRSQAEELDMVGLIEANVSVANIASVCGVSTKTVERWQAVCKLGLYEYIESKLLKQADVLKIAKAFKEIPEKKFEDALLALKKAMKGQKDLAQTNVNNEIKRAAEQGEDAKEKEIKPATHFRKGFTGWLDTLAKYKSVSDDAPAPEFKSTVAVQDRTKALKVYKNADWKDGVPSIGVEGRKWSKVTSSQLAEVQEWANTLLLWLNAQIGIKKIEEQITKKETAAATTPPAQTESQTEETQNPSSKQKPLPITKKKKSGIVAEGVGAGENPGPERTNQTTDEENAE